MRYLLKDVTTIAQNMRYLPKDTTTIPNMETLSARYLETLDP